ncbi:MAG: energy transducer TonB [Sphingomonas bacterium]|jgi:TonB family protein|uniref:energy transducer TonB n=1 Tax=Sphingomonas bacterium TaxID=1895847 RepID=UPI00260B89C9|nr:energy transducer TonB [Sphingomonas bacterium]MDB5704828.1 energy transducer TonB [Sphingomonas bacterium]
MIIGEGRSVTIAVVATGFILFLLLVVMVVIGFEDYGPRLWTSLGGRVAPPPDRALAGAKPMLIGNPATWFGSDAYPDEAVRAHEEGRTVARLQLDATGAPTSCSIVVSSGADSLDSTTCSILMKHAMLTPARDGNGVAIPGNHDVPVRWVLPLN